MWGGRGAQRPAPGSWAAETGWWGERPAREYPVRHDPPTLARCLCTQHDPRVELAVLPEEVPPRGRDGVPSGVVVWVSLCQGSRGFVVAVDRGDADVHLERLARLVQPLEEPRGFPVPQREQERVRGRQRRLPPVADGPEVDVAECQGLAGERASE